MTKPENTEEAVAWRWQVRGLMTGLWSYSTGAREPHPARDPGYAGEPLFPRSSLETRDARIAALEAALEGAVKGLESIDGGAFDPKSALIRIARATLNTIRETKP